MEKRKMRMAGLAVTAVLFAVPGVMAQDKVEASVGADLVSGYVWRGQNSGGVSVQPGLSVAYKGLSLAAWGSAGLEKDGAQELDLTLKYAKGGFSVSVTDYWFSGGAGYFSYGAHDTAHVFEAQVGYDFGFLAANWYTNFAGMDGTDGGGHRAYSSYVSLSAPFRLGGLEWQATVGATPWATTFYNGGASGFEVAEVAVGACKDLPLTSQWTLPLFARAIWNPATGSAHFVLGMSL